MYKHMKLKAYMTMMSYPEDRIIFFVVYNLIVFSLLPLTYTLLLDSTILSVYRTCESLTHPSPSPSSHSPGSSPYRPETLFGLLQVPHSSR